jgi:serine/threonine protein kinase
MTPDDIYPLDEGPSLKDMGVAKPFRKMTNKDTAIPARAMGVRDTQGTPGFSRSAGPHRPDPSADCPIFKIAGTSPFDPEHPAFTLVESLGVGGMGAVHAATQGFMGRQVAVKRSHHAEGQGPTYASVIEEGRRFGRLDHPNIPPVHMVGKDEHGHAILVMKRIEGTDLRSMLLQPDHPRWAQVDGDRRMWTLELMIRLSWALEHAHSRSILHRDIKTENVMIGDFGQMFLIDWGISVDLLDKDAAVTTDKFVGTPCFSAPEMLTAGQVLSPATDVYLLGAMLYEIMTGQVPHTGHSIGEILKKIGEKKRPNIPASVPPPLAAIIGQALEPEPADRYLSVEDFRLAVQRYKADHFLLEQLRLVEQQIATLRHWLAESKTDRATGYNFMTVAHESLSTLKTIIRGGVKVQYAQELMIENIRIQTEYSILVGQLGVARTLLAKLRDELGSNVPWVTHLANQIADATTAGADRRAELQTQSMTIMFEEMMKLKQDTDTSE